MPEIESITPSLAGRSWLKSISYPMLNRPLFRLIDRGDNLARPPRDTVTEIEGRSAPSVASDVRGSRRFTLFVQVADQAAADAMDIILASGEIFLIHTPPTACHPGGYVRLDTTSQARATTMERFVFALPCTIATPPGPDVVGATLTIGGLIALAGTVEALWALWPTIRDVWDTIGSPDDLVVI